MALAPLEGARETTRLAWGLAQSLRIRGYQTQPGVPLHTRDHVVFQGRPVRSRARSHRRLGALPHQALHQGRVALRDRDAHREMMVMALILIVDDSPPARAFLGRWWSWL